MALKYVPVQYVSSCFYVSLISKELQRAIDMFRFIELQRA